MSDRELEPTISKFALEMVDATHQHTTNVMWRIICLLGILVFICLLVIGYGIWTLNSHATITYEQIGNGNNVIGDGSKCYYGTDVEENIPAE